MKASHRSTQESIPWLVTGRIAENERAAFERHLNECAECREELAHQQLVHSAMTQDAPRIDYAPGASLQKLWNRIDAAESVATTAPTERLEPATRMPRLRLSQWLAAAVIVEAVGITFLAMRSPQIITAENAAPPAYRTLTTTEIVPETAVLRVVFSAGVSLGDISTLLRSQQLTIVSGPTAAGVYTLATTVTPQELSATLPATLAKLQTHPGVRFAEPIGRSTETRSESRP